MTFAQLLEMMDINAGELLHRFSGNEALAQRFICKFPKDVTYDALKTAYLNNDYVEQEKTAHTLKGIAANLNFTKLQFSCGTMLDSLRNGQQSLPEKFQNIAKEYERLVYLIENYTSQMQ